MASIVTPEELASHVPDGARLGVGGVHLSRLPIALIERLIALGRKDFVFTSWGGGLALELLLEAGAVRKLIFCFSSLDIFGLAPRFREALESGSVEVEEWTALAMIQGLHAAHFNLPEMPFQVPAGGEVMAHGAFWKTSSSTFTGEPVALARRLDVDVMLLHAQRADRAGNIEIQGARGLDLSMLGSAKNVLVTVEEIVEAGSLGAPRAFILPHIFVTAVARCPWGAYPTSCLPYYSTDYQELLSYARSEQARRKLARETAAHEATGPVKQNNAQRFSVNDRRRKFLTAAAQVRIDDVKPRVVAEGRSCAEQPGYSIDELLAACLSREYDNASICSVGSVSPLAMVSYLLAKRTHAPQLAIIALNGGFIDIEPHPMTLTFAEPLEFSSAKVFWGGDETYHWYYQKGRITHEVITVAQIDVRGRTNNAWINTGGKRIRLPGQGGMADVANLHQNFTLYLTRHSRERFVESVDFCTAARGLLRDAERTSAGLKPGKVRLISDLGIFELDAAARRFRLMSLHPGATLETVRERTGGKFLVAEPVPITRPPEPEQLRLIREDIDPFGIRRLEFVPAKERMGLIESILHAEAEMLDKINPAQEGWQ
jgi:glutaconate CoA-transferase, subunit A